MDLYFTKAKRFCDWLRQLTRVCPENACAVIVSLMELYAASAVLEYPEADEETDVQYDRVRLPLLIKQKDAYWEIFAPYNCEAPTCGSLTDDLNDIYNEVQQGIVLFEKGFEAEAAWHWKWSFEHHWKYHAVDAIRALNSMSSE